MSGLMDMVDQACEERLLYEIPTIRPEFVRRSYANRTRPVGMMPWHGSVKMLGVPTLRSILRTDLTLLFDAILFDRSLYNPLFNFLSTLAMLLPLARRRGRRMACYDVGAGPVDTPAGQRMLRDVAELMEFITVRDEESLDILKQIGVQNPRILLAADAAVNVVPSDAGRVADILRSVGLAPGEDILAVNINQYLDTWARPRREPMGRERFLDVFAEALDRVAAETGAAVLLVATQHHDVTISEALRARLTRARKTAFLGNVQHSHYDIKGVLGACSLLFAMRLHASILGTSALTPSLGLAYQPKVDFYYNTLGLGDCSLSFEAFTPDDVAQHLLMGWGRRRELRAHLERRIPALQREASKPALLVAAMRRGEDMDQAFARVAGEGAPP
jgi:polysaccharide pyruvyl transferase WcaK-like protein